jgi:serine/threonine protein kinase
MLERFEREAVNLERVARHNDQVPDLYAHFAEKGQFYLVQEYIEGDTVAARVGRGYPDIKAELESLQSVMDNFDLTFIRFLKSFETSPVFLQKLIAVLAKTPFFSGTCCGS